MQKPDSRILSYNLFKLRTGFNDLFLYPAIIRLNIKIPLTEKIISYGGRYASKKRGLSGSVLNTYMEPPEESPAKAPAPKPILDTKLFAGKMVS